MQTIIQRPDFEITATAGFPEWMHEQKISAAMSTYRVGAVLMLGSNPDGTAALQTAAFDRAMGMCCKENTFWLVTQRMIWRFEREKTNVNDATARGNDYLYVPRVGYTTGEVDGHEIAVGNDDKPVFVNTLFNCLATVDPQFNFRPLWHPKFIKDLAPEDRCHLSGIAIADGKPKYVTMHAQSNRAQGWRESRVSGGLVIDADTNGVVAENFSMPHSPRIHQGKLWVLNSGTGHLGFVDRKTGTFEPVTFLPGYARGLSIHSKYAFVGLSKPRREQAFQGLPLEATLDKHCAAPCCGLRVIDLETGAVVHQVNIESSIVELFDTEVLPGVLRPAMLSFTSSKYAHHFSFPHQGEIHHWESDQPPTEVNKTPKLLPLGKRTQDREHADMMAPRHMPEKTAKAFNNLGLMHVQQGNLNDAGTCFERATTLDPTHAGAWNNLGNVLKQQKESDKAITCYHKAIKSNPTYVPALFNLANELRKQNKPAEAKKHFLQVLEIEPNHVGARAAIGQ